MPRPGPARNRYGGTAAHRTPIPAAFWDELRERGLLRADVPTPA
jgi:hypothetical protein